MSQHTNRAACRPGSGVDPEIFFPVAEPGTMAHHLQTERAKDICRTCPVVSECLAWALESGQDFGVWGGMGEVERRSLRHPALLARHRAEVARRPAKALPSGHRARPTGRCAQCGNRAVLRQTGHLGAHPVSVRRGGGPCSGAGSLPMAEDRPGVDQTTVSV